jgi:C-terminal processing protease CtpA/Prc
VAQTEFRQTLGSAHQSVSHSDTGDSDFEDREVILPKMQTNTKFNLGVDFGCRYFRIEDLKNCARNRGTVVVTYVRRKSVGERLGLRVGDIIERVEGQMPDKSTIREKQGGYSGESRLEKIVWALTQGLESEVKLHVSRQASISNKIIAQLVEQDASRKRKGKAAGIY